MTNSLLGASLRVENGALLLCFERTGVDDRPLSVSVSIDVAGGERLQSTAWRPAGDDGASTTCGTIQVELRWRRLGDGLELTSTLQLFGAPSSHRLTSFGVRIAGMGQWLAPEAPVMGLRIAYCGAHSRSQTSRSYTAELTDDQPLESWWVGAVSGAHGPGLVVGGVKPERFVTSVQLLRNSCCALYPLEQWLLTSGHPLTIDPLWVGATSDAPHAALEQFAALLGTGQGARRAAVPSGWGSWGHWLERIDAGLMREMVHAIDGSDALRNVVEVVQIDDGWSELLESHRVSASWQPNRRFPSGLAPLMSEIAQTGRRSGLWLLPFAVNAGSPIAATHPEWLVHDDTGVPVRVAGSDAYCLDPTHPAAAAWLRAVLERFRDWGVGYVKLDYLRALLVPDPHGDHDTFASSRRYHAASTRLEAYRIGLSVVRAALGEQTTIVACSAPAGAGVGLIDCHRIGPDIERAWTGRLAGVRDCARAVAANWFWQGRTWVNDPDYLLECESEGLTRLWATLVALSGGSVIVSADLSTLQPWAEQMLAFVMPPVGRAARPLDLFASASEPRRWALPFVRGAETWTMLGLVNWGERPSAERIAPRDFGLTGPLHVWDVWRRRHTTLDETLLVPIEAQSAALLRLTPLVDTPTVIGTDVHWAQGWYEISGTVFDATTGQLSIAGAARSPRSGRVWIWVPPRWDVVDGAVLGADRLIEATLQSGRDTVISFVENTNAPLERLPRVS